MTIAIIVAMGRNRAIGYRNRLPWSIPEDMAHFKQLTMGHTIIMGRHTFYSLPHGALPGRRNMVVSRTVESIPGCEVFPSLESALEACNAPSGHSVGDAQGASADNTVFVIGGASVYEQALPWASVIYLTRVDDSLANADAFFPEIDMSQWTEIKKEKHTGFSFITYRSNR